MCFGVLGVDSLSFKVWDCWLVLMGQGYMGGPWRVFFGQYCESNFIYSCSCLSYQFIVEGVPNGWDQYARYRITLAQNAGKLPVCEITKIGSKRFWGIVLLVFTARFNVSLIFKWQRNERESNPWLNGKTQAPADQISHWKEWVLKPQLLFWTLKICIWSKAFHMWNVASWKNWEIWWSLKLDQLLKPAVASSHHKVAQQQKN